MNIQAARCGAIVLAAARRAGTSFLTPAILILLLGSSLLQAAPSDPWTKGTGLVSNTTLGALKDPSVVNRQWPDSVNYDVDLNTWTYDVYVPPSYDGTKPYGVVVYSTSDPWPAVVLQTASADKNLIWIAPRGVGGNSDSLEVSGVALLALYRAKELFNIDPRRVYTSGKSANARITSALSFYHSELIKGTAPSSGFGMPRLNAVTPDYIPNTSGKTDSYFGYTDLWLFGDENATNTASKANKLRSYLFARYDDYREDYFIEAFHCAYEPQGQISFLYNAPGQHTDPSDAEMEEAIDYLDRDDTFPVNANITAGAGGFSGMTNISQSGASAVEATSNGATTYTLTPTLTATAAAKTGSTFYWDNANGSTVRWLWEVKNAAPTNQKTCFGLWFANETWGGGAPISVTAGSNPGILITITQNGTLNRMIVSARSDAGGETVFYDGYFSFVSAYSTAWTSTQTGYLTGTGKPVEIRMDLNKNRWQLAFNGIYLNGTTNSIASGTQISRDNKRMVFGYWDAAVGGAMFWKHDAYTSRSNTWSPITKSIFTAATGALSGAGATPSPMELRYVIASDPILPDPPLLGPTGLAGAFSSGAVNLTWNAFAGATSYTVQRSSVSGGPYTTLQSGITGTSYSDSTAISGNIYYYTVIATTTSSGDTAPSTELAVGAGFQVDTWTGGGADANWQTTANWNTAPTAGHTLTFAGTTRLSNTNNFPANTSFGGVMFNAGSGSFTLGGNAITLTGNIANNGAYPQTVNLPVALSAGAHNLTASTGNLTMGGAISGSGSVSKTGSGTATLSVANTYSGGTTVTAGTMVFANNSAFGTGTVTLNGGTLKGSGTGDWALSNAISVAGTSTFDMVGRNTNLNGNISGAGALSISNSGGASTLTFAGNNSGYGGTLTVNGGNAVSFNAANAGSASAAWVFNDGNGGRVRINVGNNTLSFGSLSGVGQFVNNTSSSTSVLSVGALNTDTTFAGTINDNGTGLFALLKTGTGILGLTSANAYSGGTTINGGAIGVAGANGSNTNLGTGSVTVNTGGILRVGYSVTSNQNVSTTANAITLAGGSIFADDANQHLSGAITVSASGGKLGSTYNAGNNSASEKDRGLALDGIVGGSGALTIQHSRIATGQNNNTSFVAFSNTGNTYSGTLTINENTTSSEGGVYLGVNGSTALQKATVVTSAIPGGNLKFGTSPVVFKTGLGSATIGAISGSGPLVLTGYDQVNHAYGTDAIALTVGGNNASTTYSAAISGVGGLTKTGTGVLTLSGTSTYTGTTTISGGTLNVTGALSGSGTLAVNNGGALAGTGTVARAATVANGGAIAPGNNGAGTLTLSGGLTLNTGAVLKMDLAGTTTSDKIAASGAFSATGTTTINLTALGGFAGAGTYPLITGASGISASSFTVGTTPTGYAATLGVSNGTLSVTLVPPPAAPTNLTVTMGNGTASLSWTPGSGATSYTVWRSQTSGSGYSQIATGVTSANYSDTGLEAGTAYYYKVASDNVAGSVLSASETGATTIPATPTALSLVAGNGKVDLSWAASTGATGYTILRATDAAGPYTTVATGVTSASYTDTGLEAGATYYYRIVATNDSGASSEGSEVGATTIPATPTALSLVAGNGQVGLSWAASTGATGYTILRATDAAGPYTTVATGVTSTSYTDTGLEAGASYYYRIVATNDSGASSEGSGVGATTIPSAPATLSLIAGNGKVELSWTASTGATGYTILRATDAAGPYATVATGVTSTSYTDTGLEAGATYHYRIVATNGSGASTEGSEAGATTIPVAPSVLSASPGNGQVALAWTASTGATGYTVLRAESADGSYAAVAAGVTSTSYTDTAVSNGTTYFYRTIATNDSGASEGSAVVNATPAAPPSLTVVGKSQLSTGKAKIVIRGTTTGTVKSVTCRIGNKTFTARGANAWSATVPLKPGRNVITITAIGLDGMTFTKKIVVIRR